MTTSGEKPQVDDPRGNTAQADTEERLCVACGYNLFGLGDEPRCPECGLLNIPTAFRQQVWDLVDSGKWFFSGFLTPFQKRPPGWWWALDRPGDVRRSFKFAAGFLALTACLIFGTGAMADALRVEWTLAYQWSTAPPDDPERRTVVEARYITAYGLAGMQRRFERRDSDITRSPGQRLQPGQSRSSRIVIEPSLAFLPICGGIYLWVFLSWAGPALVGLWTQIRKGLPPFARAPRTIIAAANYEAHRVLYLGLVIEVWMLADAALRLTTLVTSPAVVVIVDLALMISVTLLGVAGWVGPVRSDYTRQLIRSRAHAVRIVLMYALALPWAMTCIIAGAYRFLVGFGF